MKTEPKDELENKDGVTPIVEVKSGARNSAADTEKLRKLRALLDELDPQEIEEAEETEDKPMDAYAKSIGLIVTPEILAVKNVGLNEIKGYSMLWGGEKVTDLEIEYFKKGTDFWDAQLGKSARPLTWDHAQDADMKADPRIGVITDFGDDEVGRWYVAKLDQAHRYRKAVDALIEAGKLGTSSDSAPQYVERVKTGKATWIKTWPWFASALTNQPAEPRMVGSIDYLKSIGVCLPETSETVWQWQIARMKRLKLFSY